MTWIMAMKERGDDLMAEEKDKGGRPPMYKTPEEMQKKIDAYFARCKEDELFPTMSGLAYELEFTTQALRDYEKKDEFLCTVKRAKQFVEMAWEQALLSGKGSGPIFWLKNNAGWKDKKDVDLVAEVNVRILTFTESQEDDDNN